jgi:ferrochelatase
MPTRAVLFANLGSPDKPEVPEVRRYLDQFLMDPYVIQLPWLLRRLIVSLFVLPRRPAQSAEAYRSVWTEQGSPLITLSMELLQKLRERCELPLGMAMRYGNPSIGDELEKLARIEGVEEVLFVPLYPHYAESTVLTAVKEAEAAIAARQLPVRLKVLPPFYQDPDYIAALAESARPWLQQDFDMYCSATTVCRNCMSPGPTLPAATA